MSLHPRILFTGLLLAGTALAQQPRPIVPPKPPSGPQGPLGGPTVPDAVDPQAGIPLADRVEKIGWIEPNINGERLGALYTELTGRRVTISNAAISGQFRFVQSGPVTYGEAAQLLKVAALVEGFVFVPAGPNHDRLMYAPGNLSPRSVGLPVITTASELPEGDSVVTYIMSLKNIKPDDAKRAFEAVLMGTNPNGSIAPVPNASAVIITDNTSLIRTLIEIQAKIDVPPTNVQTRFIKVQYADVTELAETINSLVGNQQGGGSAGAGGGGQRPQGGGAQTPPGIPQPEGAGAGESVPIQIVPNPRTNEIFTMGRPADIVFVEGLIKGFDSQTDQKNFLRRKLKFLAVADFLPVAQQAIQRTFSSGQGAGAAGASGANFGQGGGRNGQGATNTGSRTGTQSASATPSSSSSTSGSTSGSSSSGTSGSTGGLTAPAVNTAPVPLLVGRTLLVADNITNSVVIQGPPASLELVNKLLDQLDVKAEQVMISCVFGQLRLDDTKSFGIDYLRTLNVSGNNAIAGRGGSGTGSLIPLNGTTAFDPGTLATGSPGLGLYGKIGPYLNIYLSALQTDEKFTVLSRPTIYVSNSQKGSITSGTKIAVPTGSYNGGASSGISTNFEYRDVDLKLEVIPLVNSASEVTLQIYLTSDDLGSNRTVGEFQIPDILDRTLITTVTVPNDETIVLGGLITSHDDRTKNGIPILSQIPYIGGLFGTNAVTKSRDELLVFIQPKIVVDSNSLYQAQADMNGRYKVDDLGRDFIQSPGNVPVKDVTPPVVDPKASKKSKGSTDVLPESEGGPRRASSRPAGFQAPK